MAKQLLNLLIAFGGIGVSVLVATTSAQQQVSPKRLFIEERKKNGEALEVTRRMQKRCPSTITVTENQDTADYKLTISIPTSAFYNAKGDVVHVFRTPLLLKNMAKEVCDFVASQH
jgi:hypothetical protein